jgi:Predicted membrane protein
MRDQKTNTLVKISALAAVAALLMVLDFPLTILFPAFLKVDVSELPAVIGAFAMGPVAGLLIEFVKNIIHFLIKPDTLGIGELANFIVGSAYVLVAGAIYSLRKNKSHAVIGLVSGTVALTVAGAIGNVYVFLPLYQKFLGWKLPPNVVSYVIYTITPFNLFKGVLVSVLALLIYKRISPILHK